MAALAIEEKEIEQKYTIYRLIDPRGNSTRYVGLSSNVLRRYAAHILGNDPSQKNDARRAWLEDLNQQGLMPTLDILESGIEDRRQAEEREAYWIGVYHNSGADLINILGIPRVHHAPAQPHVKRITQMRQIRESLVVSQEGLARRTRSITTRTVRNAEDGKRVTNDTATQILEAINVLLAEKNRPTITLNDLGLTLY